jgi:hypothetical protein
MGDAAAPDYPASFQNGGFGAEHGRNVGERFLITSPICIAI